jgi:hypothetical protein
MRNFFSIRCSCGEFWGVALVSCTCSRTWWIAAPVKRFEGIDVKTFIPEHQCLPKQFHHESRTKKQIVGDELMKNPDRSNRAIAAICQCDHKTVGRHRRELLGKFPKDAG